MLADDKNNYICSIYTRKVRSRWKAGICFADISTGEAYATELTAEKMARPSSPSSAAICPVKF